MTIAQAEINIHVERLSLKDTSALKHLFNEIAHDSQAEHFHPHPFTEEYVKKITEYQGLDIYLGAFEHGRLIGYGMLRGWDANYTVPSLGIYLAPLARGRGFSHPFMRELHRFAQEMGATKVRLKVYAKNTIAVDLYTKMGYSFVSEEENQLVGYLNFLAQ